MGGWTLPPSTPANFHTRVSTPETLIPEGNKSRVSGDALESNYTEGGN